MGPEFGRFLPIYLACLFASGMALFFSHLDKPGAYIAVCLLGAGVLASLRAQERRIRELERRLEERDAPAEPIAAVDRGRNDAFASGEVPPRGPGG